MYDLLYIDNIMSRLSKCSHELCFYDRYHITTWNVGKFAIRFWLDCGPVIISPMSPNNGKSSIFKEQIRQSKSLYVEGGIFAIPFHSFKATGIVEKYIFNVERIYLAILEYDEDDVIYENDEGNIEGGLHEVCISRANIVYSGYLDDVLANLDSAIRSFKKKKERIYFLREAHLQGDEALQGEFLELLETADGAEILPFLLTHHPTQI